MTKGHFWPLHAPLWHWRGPNYGHYGGQNRAGWLQDNDSAWKPFCAPYHTLLYGQTWLRAIFDLSMHPYGTGEVQTITILVVKTGPLWRVGYRMRTPPGNRLVRHITPFYMAKHDWGQFLTSPCTLMALERSKQWPLWRSKHYMTKNELGSFFYLSTHIYGTGEIQSMVITRLIVAGWLQDKEYTDTRCTLHTVYFSFVFMLDDHNTCFAMYWDVIWNTKHFPDETK